MQLFLRTTAMLGSSITLLKKTSDLKKKSSLNQSKRLPNRCNWCDKIWVVSSEWIVWESDACVLTDWSNVMYYQVLTLTISALMRSSSLVLISKVDEFFDIKSTSHRQIISGWVSSAPRTSDKATTNVVWQASLHRETVTQSRSAYNARAALRSYLEVA